MNPLIHLKQTTSAFLVAFALACFGLCPAVRAVNPAPDGGYPNGNTAEGSAALFMLTTGSHNTAIGLETLAQTTTGSNNTAIGYSALFHNSTLNGNTAIGYETLFNNTGTHNTASGTQALYFNAVGINNTANGAGALLHNTDASNNTADGFEALFNNTTGGSNIALGYLAGGNLTTGSDNIDIGNAGIVAESRTIRIGTGGAQLKTFIAGIHGATASGGTMVFVNSSGQLGTLASSERFKENIKPMDNASDAILTLKPVTFRYKHEVDPNGIPQFGLVAEQVEKVNPDLVVRDQDGKPYSVRYEAVNAMLLNEFLKAHRRMQQQDKRIEELTAKLKEQSAQIQKVSAQLEVSKPAPQTVLNDQ